VLFLGRMSPEKGVVEAIDAARGAGVRLVIAAKCSEAVERAYRDEEVLPRLGPDIDFIGQVDDTQKKDLLARARCLVFPIQWEEPFGLVMVEAMACATPVVALNRGAVPDVVAHGRTGFVCDRLDQLPGAIARVDLIDPALCRAEAERRFDGPAMVAGYEHVYRGILERSLARAAFSLDGQRKETVPWASR
jgi:glycosyltransferase involved in cell wall biosynthesis